MLSQIPNNSWGITSFKTCVYGQVDGATLSKNHDFKKLKFSVDFSTLHTNIFKYQFGLAALDELIAINDGTKRGI